MDTTGTLNHQLTTLPVALLVEGDELIQTGAGRDHGENGNLLVGDDLEKGGALRVDEPLETLDDLIGLDDALSLDAHGIGELDEVGVLLVGVRVAVVVEEVLPLRDHALLLVVEDDDLDANVELSRSGELGEGHAEGGIAVNVNDESIRLGDLGADGGGETIAHGTETTGGDHGTGVAPAEVLSGPHLMLADTGGDVGVVLAALDELAELLDEGLRLDQTGALGALVVGKGPLGLPLVDLAEPLLAIGHGLGLNLGNEELDVGGNITLDSLGSLDDLVDVLGKNLEVDDTTTTLGGGSLGSGSKLVEVKGDTVVETATKADDQIGLLDGHVGVSGTVHTEHVERLLVELIESTETVEGGGNGDRGLLRESAEELRTALGLDNTVAGIDDGLLGDVDELGDTVDRGIELLAAQLNGSARGGAGNGGDGGVGGDGAAKDTSGDILGKIDEDGARSAASGDLEGLVNAARKLGDTLHHDVPLGARPRDTNDVGLLKSVAANGSGGNLAGEDDHWSTVGKGIGHRGDDVGRTGTGGDEDDTGLARSTGVTLSHVTSTLFVAGEDEVEVGRVVDGIEDGENGTARIAENVLYAVSEHHLVEDFTTSLADEPA